MLRVEPIEWLRMLALKKQPGGTRFKVYGDIDELKIHERETLQRKLITKHRKSNKAVYEILYKYEFKENFGELTPV